MAAVVNETVDDGWLAFFKQIERDNELDAAEANISERAGALLLVWICGRRSIANLINLINLIELVN